MYCESIFHRFKPTKLGKYSNGILKLLAGKTVLENVIIRNGWGGSMPLKVRQLKSSLSKAGFYWRPGKGSHTVWYHPHYPGVEVTISGRDGDDADKYQLRQVNNALKRTGGK